jgi:pyruvate dehydrogenase E2 component (dihydrolipoamide acetyltransferase)
VTQEIRIPDIGDAESVEVVEILVAAGDTVGPDDPVIVIESDKASMEVPAGIAGIIERVVVAVGDEVTPGQVIATLTAASADQAGAADDAEPLATEQPAEAPAKKAARKSAEEPAAEPAQEPAEKPAERAPEPAAEAGAGEQIDVKVPDIGEAEAVVVIEIAVSVGDHVGADDLLVVIESDKASMEIPVGVAGTVVALHVKEGDEVSEGARLATIESATAEGAKRQPETAKPAPAATATATPKAQAPAAASPAAGASAAAPDTINADTITADPINADTSAGADADAQVYAGPAVRRLARELGVTLQAVTGSGPRGRIVKDDVKRFVKDRLAAPTAAKAGAALPAIPVIDFSRFGEIEKVPLSRIRARGADNLHRSWLNIPHVTQHDEVDVTDLEAFRKSLKAEAEAQGVKLTPIAFIIKACCQALREFPTVNASLDPEARNFILKRYYHIGIAVDTDDGLVVPVIRDADQKGILALSREVVALSDKARANKLSVADHQGGTFTVTSLGALGGTGFTPVINAPEVAILGVGRLAVRPHWDGAAFVPRQMLPLSLSYDHRAINGAEAGRFVARLGQLLADVRRLAL